MHRLGFLKRNTELKYYIHQ